MEFSRDAIEQLDKEFRRNLINSLSGLKTAFLCGTVSLNGIPNLSLISSVVHVGANPPLLGMIIRPPSVPRHTLTNLLHTGFFTLNLVSREFLEQAHQAAARYPAEKSEFDAVGLTPLYTEKLPAPYVKESSLRIGLKLAGRMNIDLNDTVFIIGEIQEILLPDDAANADGTINFATLDPALVGGLDAYHRATFIKRLPYPKATR